VVSYLSQMPATGEAIHFIFNPWNNFAVSKSAFSHTKSPICRVLTAHD
jgi:hypothetical protein